MARDIARICQPYFVAMAEDMFKRAPQLAQTERLTENKGVQDKGADQRMRPLVRLVQHLVELIDPDVHEFSGGVLAIDNQR